MKDPEKYIAHFSDKDRFGSMLGGRILSISAHECVYEFTPLKDHFNPNGILHGGALFSVMDSCQGAFVHYVLDPIYKFAATGTATIRFQSPALDETIKIRTWLTKTERRKLVVNSSATGVDGREIATLEEIWIAIPV